MGVDFNLFTNVYTVYIQYIINCEYWKIQIKKWKQLNKKYYITQGRVEKAKRWIEL